MSFDAILDAALGAYAPAMNAKLPSAMDHPALAWRRAGLSDMTGECDRAPLICPASLTCYADTLMARLHSMADDPATLPVNGAVLLGERGRLLGLRRRGRLSPNGSCNLMDARDGGIALNLPRPEDWDMLPALFEVDAVAEEWPAVAGLMAARSAPEMAARAIDLGLAVALVEENAPPSLHMIRGGTARDLPQPRVLDLSGLWAGPLCGSLLGILGAHVLKLEHVYRPDGARRQPAFFDLLNAGKAHRALDFTGDRARLADLVEQADIIIEASRPRALEQFGLDARKEIARGAIWVSITAHGRARGNRIGFGDDCAVAGGLAKAMAESWGHPMMVGDAIADPLTGLFAAYAAWSLWRSGRGGLLDIAMSGVVADAVRGAAFPADIRQWQDMAMRDQGRLYPLRNVPHDGDSMC